MPDLDASTHTAPPYRFNKKGNVLRFTFSVTR